MEPKSIKPDRILGIILPPFVVAVFPEGLQRMVVSRGDAAIDEPPYRGLGFGGAKISRLEDGAQRAFGRDRILADVFPVARQHAAEVLRPWPVDHRLDDHVADMSSAQFKGFRRVADEHIDLSADEELDWSGFWGDHPIPRVRR